MEVICERDGEVISKKYESGDYFGQEFLLKDIPWNITSKAIGHVDIFVLKRRDFDDVMKLYKDDATIVKSNMRKVEYSI